ncbi:MAG: TPM domain-containing protein [Clostridium sp.]|nr:TPM domain-containing protein [Clostridium sp.]
MKRMIRLLSLILVLLLFAGAVPAYAADWNEDYYRASDMSGELTDAERNDLDAMCIEIMKEQKVDVTLLALRPEDYEGSSFEDVADTHYTASRYGYGANADGFLMVCDAETGEAEIFTYGNAAERIPEDYLEFIEGTIPGYREQYGVYGMMYAAAKHISKYLEEHPEGAAAAPVQAGQAEDLSAEIAQAEGGAAAAAGAAGAAGSGSGAEMPTESYTDMAGNVHVGPGTGKPAWYPVEPQNFTRYQDASASRVVDAADLFTDAEEQKMEQRLAEIRGEIGRDIVIYTDSSAYGFEHNILAADFYDFNGYGMGDDFEGACLLICMDPEDRGFYTVCTGEETKALYTEEFANQMDDVLYEYMVNGQYGDGAADWIENFYTLYTKGMPFPPEWYDPDYTDAARTNNASAPRIDDTAGLFTADEIQKLTDQAKKISDKYGLDVVVHTAESPAGLSPYEYAELYYKQCGYGFGDNYDGIVLTMFRDGGYNGHTDMYASGTGLKKLTDVNRDRLLGFAEDDANAGKYYSSASGWLSNVAHMEKTGRVSRSLFYWLMTLVMGSGLGSIFGGVSLGGAKARMKVPKPQVNADRYLVPGSLRVAAMGGDHLINTRTDRRYVPPAPKSSDRGGGSSGGSTFHSSFSGSSGTSHSGSGRKF